MQCGRCGSVVPDSSVICQRCGNSLTQVDSYGATSFAPVMPAPQPAAHVSVKNMTAPMEALGTSATLMATQAPADLPGARYGASVPPTMASNAPPIQQQRAVITPSPRYVVTPAQGSQPPPVQQIPTLHSPSAYGGPVAPYAPPPMGMMHQPQYPMMQQQLVAQQGTPGMAVAALICGLLGWIPLWIGFILCLLAITFASIVLAQTKPGQPGRGLAITGLVFGLVLLLPAACGL